MRLRFRRPIGAGIAVSQRPTLLHQPGVDIRTVRQGANRKHAPVAVEARRLALELPPGKVVDQLMGCGPSARPRSVGGIGAGLVALGSIDSLQAEAGAGDVDGVAVDHPCLADDVPTDLGWRSVIRMLQAMDAERTRQHEGEHQRSGADRLGSGPTQARSRLPSSCLPRSCLQSAHPARRAWCHHHGRQSCPPLQSMSAPSRAESEFNPEDRPRGVWKGSRLIASRYRDSRPSCADSLFWPHRYGAGSS